MTSFCRVGQGERGDGRRPEWEPVILKDVLKKVMLDLAPAVSPLTAGLDRELGSAGQIEKLQNMWATVVGPEIANLSRVTRYRGGVLTVRVSSSPLLSELRGFARDKLQEELNEAGLEALHDLRLVAGA